MLYATLTHIIFLFMLCTNHAIFFPSTPTTNHPQHPPTCPFLHLTNPPHYLTYICTITYPIPYTTFNHYINPPQYNHHLIQPFSPTHIHDMSHLHNLHSYHKQHFYPYITHPPPPTDGTLCTHTIHKYIHYVHCRYSTPTLPPHQILFLPDTLQTLHLHHIHPSTYPTMNMTSRKTIPKLHSAHHFHPTSPHPLHTPLNNPLPHMPHINYKIALTPRLRHTPALQYPNSTKWHSPSTNNPYPNTIKTSDYWPRPANNYTSQLINTCNSKQITNQLCTNYAKFHLSPSQAQNLLPALPNLFTTTTFTIVLYIKTHMRKPKTFHFHGYYFTNKLALLKCGDIELNHGPMPNLLHTHPATHKKTPYTLFQILSNYNLNTNP